MSTKKPDLIPKTWRIPAEQVKDAWEQKAKQFAEFKEYFKNLNNQ